MTEDKSAAASWPWPWYWRQKVLIVKETKLHLGKEKVRANFWFYHQSSENRLDALGANGISTGDVLGDGATLGQDQCQRKRGGYLGMADG